MKKLSCLLIVLLLVLSLSTGCGQEEKAAAGNAAEESTSATAAIENPPSGASDSAIDLDLTQLSSILVYSEVFSMMERPEEYMGKTMKMAGLYYCLYDETTESAYHFVIIEDALECCQQGIEFVWKGDHAYPQDYPEEGAVIEVTGSLEVYEESAMEYYRLAADELTIL